MSDKLDEYKANLWNEFLGSIGISNINLTKKERLIKDEVMAQLGGSIAMRSSRFEAQKDAIEEINEKFKDYLEKPLELEFYDGVPTTDKENIDIVENKESEDITEGGGNDDV